MKGFSIIIEKGTLENNNFRKVPYITKHLQLVVMSLKVREETGEEIHSNNHQFFRFESGNGKCVIDGNVYQVFYGDLLIVPAEAKRNIIYVDEKLTLKMYTIYATPNHENGLIKATKNEADESGKKNYCKTTE